MAKSGVHGEKTGRIWSDLVGLAAAWSGGVMGMSVHGSGFRVLGSWLMGAAFGSRRAAENDRDLPPLGGIPPSGGTPTPYRTREQASRRTPYRRPPPPGGAHGLAVDARKRVPPNSVPALNSGENVFAGALLEGRREPLGHP